jgi:hypothetical protein
LTTTTTTTTTTKTKYHLWAKRYTTTTKSQETKRKMKVSGAAILALSCIPSTVAFVTTSHKSSTSQLNLKADNKNDWFGPTVTAVAGLTLASQMAVASVVADPTAIQQDTSFAPIIRQGKRHLKLKAVPSNFLSHTQTPTEILFFVYVKC